MLDTTALERKIERGETEDVARVLGEIPPDPSGSMDAEAGYIAGILHFRFGDYRNALEVLEEAGRTADEGGNGSIERRITNYRIWIGLKAGMNRSVRGLFKKLQQDRGRKRGRTESFFFLNHAYAISLDIGFIESEKYSEKLIANALEGLEHAERAAGSRDAILKGRIGIVRGLLYQQEEQWDRADKEFRRSLQEMEKEKLMFLQADVLEEMGNLQFRSAREFLSSDRDEAFVRFRKAIDAYERSSKVLQGRNRDAEGIIQSGIGEAYYMLGKYDRAAAHHENALAIFRELDYPHGIALEEDALGRISLRSGKVKEGLNLLKSAHKTFKKLDVRHETLLTRVHLVDGYFLLSRSRGKKELKKLLYNEPVKRFRDCYRELKEVVNREDWLREDPELGELFIKPLPRYITLELMEQIIQAAKRSHPNEFGALIHGDPILDRLEFVLDSARGSDTFMFSLYSRYSGQYLYADGSVHSHPSGAAIPSKADLSFFGRFPNVNIIMGYPYTLDSWAAYDRNGNKIQLKVIYRADKEKVEAQIRKLIGSGKTTEE